MRQYRIGILGATGAVGREMMKVLEERKFPISELRLLAGAGSAGKRIGFIGKEHTVIQASEDAFEGLDIVLGAAENDIAMRFAPAIVKAGAVFVDNSSAFRLYEDVPLVVSEINPEDVRKHRGIIANPNCTTIISLVALNALNKESPIESIIASSYQAVSGAGAQGISELSEETGASCETLTPLGEILASPGGFTEVLHLYMATGLTFGSQHPDEDEFINFERVPFDALLDRCLSGDLRDGKTVAGVLKVYALRTRKKEEK